MKRHPETGIALIFCLFIGAGRIIKKIYECKNLFQE